MQKNDDELTGERLNALILEFGAAEAVSRLFHKYGRHFLAIIGSYLRRNGVPDPKVNAEDVVSQAYLEVQKDFEKYEKGEKPSDYTSPFGFLIAVGINLSKKHIGRNIRMEKIFYSPSSTTEETSEEGLDRQNLRGKKIDAAEDSPEAQVIKKEFRVFVDTFILQFTQKQQAAFTLFFYEGYSHNEIGELIHIDPVNSRAYVSRIVKKLRPHAKKLFGGLK